MSEDLISKQTAEALVLTYGRDAREMAELRIKELEQRCDQGDGANWRQVLAWVEGLLATQAVERSAKHWHDWQPRAHAKQSRSALPSCLRLAARTAIRSNTRANCS